MKTVHYILIFSLFVFSAQVSYGFFGSPTPRPKLVMINPAGDARRTGRRLSNNYERAITYKLAEALAKELENRYHMNTIVTRTPGKELLPLQNASLANRAHIDFFIDINIYKEEQEKPKIYLMHRMLDPLADIARRTYPTIDLIPIVHAHNRNIHQTKSFSERIAMTLTQQDHQKLFDFIDLHGIPLKPLMGIIAPAVLFDIGLNDEEKWPMLVEPITTSLKFLLDY